MIVRSVAGGQWMKARCTVDRRVCPAPAGAADDDDDVTSHVSHSYQCNSHQLRYGHGRSSCTAMESLTQTLALRSRT